AKFVVTKKISEHDNIAAITGTAPGQRRINMPANAGRVIAAQTTSVIRQSSPASVTLLSNTAASGTITASPGIRSIRPANSALAANGHTPAACGSRRAATSKPIRNATSSKSIQKSARVLFGCIVEVLYAVRAVHSTIGRKFTTGFAGVHSRAQRPAFLGPFGNDSGQLIESVGERGRSRLENQRCFDLAQPAAADGRNFSKSRTGRNLAWDEFLAA